MSYWNKISLNKLLKSDCKKQVKYKINTDIGRFYFYFETEPNSGGQVSGKLIFFPNATS